MKNTNTSRGVSFRDRFLYTRQIRRLAARRPRSWRDPPRLRSAGLE